MVRTKEKSALIHVLLALVPYTRDNLLLVFSPNRFFNELEKSSSHSASSLRTAYSRAKKDNIIAVEKSRITLSIKARQIVQPFVANKLSGGGQLMVIFDIPEVYANRRRQLRSILRSLGFKQIQQSVWSTSNDHRLVVFDTILDLDLADYVQLYEAARID